MEIVYLQALRAESAHAERGHSAFLLWDLSNYYEHVSWDKLWDRCKEMQFSLVIAAASLNQYAGRRFVGLGNLTLDAQNAD